MEDINYKEFERATKGIIENQKGLDRIIFVLNTGIFVLSVNFILGNKNVFLFKTWVLLASWICLGLSIALHAVGYMVGTTQWIHQAKMLGKEIEKDNAFFAKKINF